MTALICGSIAYDNIMVFEDSFRNHILPEQIHILNVAFLVPELRREFGGCAMNIAYNLKLLGEDPLPMGTAGIDFDPYREWLDRCSIRRDHVRVLDDVFTAQAFITTDLDDNQITAFHPGAMNHSHVNHVADAAGATIGIVSPDGREGMVRHAEEFVAAGIPFVFDPGQGLPMFDGEALRRFVDQATWVTVNDYEWQLLKERTGWDAADVAATVEALIITRGAQGSVIHAQGREHVVPAVPPRAVRDPTGCGDAYRAGLLFALATGLSLDAGARLGSLMGSLKVARSGPQSIVLDLAGIRERYRKEFGESL